MQIQSKIPDFEELSCVLAEADSITKPAEVHGMLTALICVGQRLDGQFFFDTVLRQVEAKGAVSVLQKKLIIDLYHVTCQQLGGFSEQGLRLLLPGDDQPIRERAITLSQWCEGFLYGLELSGDPASESHSEAVHQALDCMAELADLDFANIEINEHHNDMDKATYRWIVDYIKESVMFMYNEFTKKPRYQH